VTVAGDEGVKSDMASQRSKRALRTSVGASAAVALMGTIAYEVLKELLLPAISRWESHIMTIAYATVAAAAIAAAVHRGVGRIREEARALQGWGERNEAALQAFIDAIPEPSFLVDRRHAVLRLNDALATRLGRPRADVVGRDPFALLPDAHLAKTRAARIDEVFDRGEAVAFQDTNGAHRYVNHLCPVRGPDGGVWAVGVVAIDITAIHVAQEKLRLSEELLRFGLAAAGLGVWEWDICTDDVIVSSGAIQLLGGREVEWRGSFTMFLQHVEPQDRVRVEESLRTAAAGRVCTEPLRFRGSPIPRRPPRWVEIQGRLFRDPGGRVRMVGTVADAAARMESEARGLRADQAVRLVTRGTAGHTGQEFFPSLVEALARCLGTRWVLAGRLTEDGDAIQSLACWADRPASDCSLPVDGPLDESVVRRWVGAATAGVRPDVLSAIAVPIVSREGHTIGVVAACDDKPLADLDTARLVLALSAVRAGAEIVRLDKEAEIMTLNIDLERRVEERTNELTAANRELEAFSYSVSHDLRAPLRSIDGFTLALLEDYGERIEPEARQYIEIVRNESQRMGQLIDDLLGLARLTRGRLVRARVDVSTMAVEIVEELRRREPDRTVDVTVAPALTTYADVNLLRIALDNLIGNAWKFTARRADAHIELGVEASSSEPTFYVRDNGAGFDSRLGGKLFQPFVRLHPASEYEGTGIGLATVARIIKRHGGHIAADSRPGEGATFRWTLREPGEAVPLSLDEGRQRGSRPIVTR
jgi:PAS domain S-box-containing protein